jgi:hypothetical protein
VVDQALESVDLCGQVLREVLDVGVVDDFEALLQLVLVVHRRQLQVTLDLLPDLLVTIDNRYALDRVYPVQRLDANVDQLVLPGDLPEVYYRLGGRVDPQHRVGVGSVSDALVMVDYDLVVVLSPGEDVVPVGQIVGYHWQTVAPRFHDGLHVVKRILVTLEQSLVDLVGLLQFHDLLGRLQVRQVDVADDVGQTSPLVQAEGAGALDVPLDELERFALVRLADEQKPAVHGDLRKTTDCRRGNHRIVVLTFHASSLGQLYSTLDNASFIKSQLGILQALSNNRYGS